MTFLYAIPPEYFPGHTITEQPYAEVNYEVIQGTVHVLTIAVNPGVFECMAGHSKLNIEIGKAAENNYKSKNE